MSSLGEGGESGKFFLWFFFVYDKKDLIKLYCWDFYRCLKVFVVFWVWSLYCLENLVLVFRSLVYLVFIFYYLGKCYENELEFNIGVKGIDRI